MGGSKANACLRSIELIERREKEFRKNETLEVLLSEVNFDLHLSEQRLISHYQRKTMQYPLILVMGPLRSGTTLFMQWMANSGLVAYPTNLLSRFYQAPILGSKIQLMLTDPRFNYRDELGEFVQEAVYKSENGKTQGVLAPNEFWYFWRRFLAVPNQDVWSDAELRQSMDVATMQAELNGIMDVFQKPFAAKGMLFNYNIPFLDSVFERVLFVQLAREPVANVASILQARKRQLGSDSEWYSFKIPEYEQLKGVEPVAQAVRQLHFINKAVAKGLETVDESRKLTIEYEDFCAAPASYYELLQDKLCLNVRTSYTGPMKFDISRPEIDTREIMCAIRSIEE